MAGASSTGAEACAGGLFEEICAAMARPAFYAHDPRDVQVHETAISVVFVAGELVYKLKRPVALPFVDQRDPRRRRELCCEELRLNRRLAPQTYLGVCAIVRHDGGYRLADRGDDGALEWAVQMRRLPEQRTMAALLGAGKLDDEAVGAVARRLAAFHQTADPPGHRVGPGSVKRQIDENFQPLLDLELTTAELRQLAAAQRFFAATLIARAATLHARAAGGRVRDGHGDLRLEHIIVRDSRIDIIDCVEFDAALRQIDVGCDLAYLVMDLLAHDGEALADRLVAAYRQAGGDPGDDALLAFFAAYRAWVRVKLAYLGDAPAAKLIAVGERLRWRARRPLLLVVCGVSASGKSTLAQHLAAASGLPWLSSDTLRKQRAGIAPDARAGPEQYRPAVSRQVYRELGDRARGALAGAGGVVIDATFRRREDREAFTAALGTTAAAAVFVECRAPRDVLLARARRREADPRTSSDATAELVDRQRREWQNLDEIAPIDHVMLRADRDPPAIIDDLEAFLDQRSAGGAHGIR